jgi:hypothetical protein
LGPERVFDGEHLRAILWPGRRDRLIVTFDYRMDGKTTFTPDAHLTTFYRLGYPQLSIKSARNDWFVNPDTNALAKALSNLPGRFARVQMLGFSMGGYGALRFAGALDARSAVIVSPQVSISPSVAPFDSRYVAYADGFDPVIGDLSRCSAPRLRGLIVIDPFVRADLEHARRIKALFPGLSIVRLNFGGHPAIRVLRGAGAIPAIQREAMVPRAKAAGIIEAHRAARAQSPGYWSRLAATATPRHPALAAHATSLAAALPARRGDPAEPADSAAPSGHERLDATGESP